MNIFPTNWGVSEPSIRAGPTVNKEASLCQTGSMFPDGGNTDPGTRHGVSDGHVPSLPGRREESPGTQLLVVKLLPSVIPPRGDGISPRTLGTLHLAPIRVHLATICIQCASSRGSRTEIATRRRWVKGEGKGNFLPNSPSRSMCFISNQLIKTRNCVAIYSCQWSEIGHILVLRCSRQTPKEMDN